MRPLASLIYYLTPPHIPNLSSEPSFNSPEGWRRQTRPRARSWSLNHLSILDRSQPVRCILLLAILLLFAIPPQAQADNTGLVGYWSFDEGTGITTT